MMTREEAIEHLNTIGQYYSQDHSDPYEECERLTEDELEALEMAIKALDQEPSGDLISREAVLDLAKLDGRKGLGTIIHAFDVEQLPSVNPQEPSGETVSLEAFKQVLWERDIAIGQLKELGYGFGQKIEPCGDAISRQAVIDLVLANHTELNGVNVVMYSPFYQDILQLPTVTPQPKTGWNNHQIACMLADLFGDACACNYNGIDEWLPKLCDFKDTCCPNPVGVACWEQFLKYSRSRYTECGYEVRDKSTLQEPKTGHCRDCKWWKDSDGAYRRGIGAESKCPINRIEVQEGNGYCYMFEPKESEEV